MDHATAGDLHVGVVNRAVAAKSELKLKQPSVPHMHVDKNGDEFTPRSSDYQVHFPPYILFFCSALGTYMADERANEGHVSMSRHATQARPLPTERCNFEP